MSENPQGEMIAPKYSFRDVEEKWYSYWEKEGLFEAKKDPDKKPYVIVIPPPNVTGILHMGHALNNTIQDILIRWQRMKGVPALWVPGTDHAGIATQNVVERKLAKEGKSRHELGRDAFVKAVWDWKAEYGSTIVHQLRRLGASCDWTRERFTMDEGLSQAVRETFVQLYKEDLIYRGNYIINWCPRCQTALSDEEAPHQEKQGKLYHYRYLVRDKKTGEILPDSRVVIATTRPETMLGDVALAVHPDDARYADLDDKEIVLPLLNRTLKLIRDEYVDPSFGTGVVKVTPAHDPNDFAMGQRHQLEQINVMNPDATINENGGVYAGLDRFEARKRILKDLADAGLMVKEEEHSHQVPHCYRCNTVVEPYLSRQWFVRMQPLAEKALKAQEEGHVKFYPDRWTKVYRHWLDGIRDWCISRQIWWGHRIPVWYCNEEVYCGLEAPEGDGWNQEEDVLDTWFSSWLWPFSTLGWPNETEDLDYFYPTHTLVTAPDIIFFWVARMIMSGLHFRNEVPFKDVYIHGTVRDATGAKMSKSLGNALDPLEIIDEIGADALRFSIIMLTASGQDAFLSKERFDLGRNFTNKIWNATRFILMRSEGHEVCQVSEIARGDLDLADRWIISRLQALTADTESALEQYRFNEAAQNLYHFIWNDFCDWYLEMAKPFLDDDAPQRKRVVLAVMFHVLDQGLRLLHPVMPFITEEIWQILRVKVPSLFEESKSIMTSEFPRSIKESIDVNADESVKIFQTVVTATRDLRAHLGISPKEKLTGFVKLNNQALFDEMTSLLPSMERLTNVNHVLGSEWERKPGWVAKVFGDIEVAIEVGKHIDADAERKRIDAQIEEQKKRLAGIAARLGNENFRAKAPAKVIEAEEKLQEEINLTIKGLEENRDLLQNM